MSQSATWDALRLAADFRAWGRGEDAAHVMPDPEVAWLRFQTSQRSMRFFEDVAEEEGDEPPPPRGQQIREYRERWAKVDWLAWRSRARLDLTAFDPMIREHYTPDHVARMAMQRNPVFETLARTAGRRFVERFPITYMNPTTYEQLRQRIEGRITEAGGVTHSALARRGVVAALTALHGYRWPHG